MAKFGFLGLFGSGCGTESSSRYKLSETRQKDPQDNPDYQNSTN